jgi:hypothetical protein
MLLKLFLYKRFGVDAYLMEHLVSQQVTENILS